MKVMVWVSHRGGAWLSNLRTCMDLGEVLGSPSPLPAPGLRAADDFKRAVVLHCCCHHQTWCSVQYYHDALRIAAPFPLTPAEPLIHVSGVQQGSADWPYPSLALARLQLSADGGLHAALAQAVQQCKPQEHQGWICFCPVVRGFVLISATVYADRNCLTGHLASSPPKLINR